jgi:hypothetical protein
MYPGAQNSRCDGVANPLVDLAIEGSLAVLIELQAVQLEILVLPHDGPVVSSRSGPPDWANESLLHPCSMRTFIAERHGAASLNAANFNEAKVHEHHHSPLTAARCDPYTRVVIALCSASRM